MPITSGACDCSKLTPLIVLSYIQHSLLKSRMTILDFLVFPFWWQKRKLAGKCERCRHTVSGSAMGKGTCEKECPWLLFEESRPRFTSSKFGVGASVLNCKELNLSGFFLRTFRSKPSLANTLILTLSGHQQRI